MTARVSHALTCAALVLAGAAAPAAQVPLPAQIPPGAQVPSTPAPAPATAAWQWSGAASVFAGFNYQQRRFLDFDAWESQNWLMGAVERREGAWTVRGLAMLTFEPFSIEDIGSPQAFQTGETFNNAPIIDYQHPHDLLMQLAAEARRTAGRAIHAWYFWRLVIVLAVRGFNAMGDAIRDSLTRGCRAESVEAEPHNRIAQRRSHHA